MEFLVEKNKILIQAEKDLFISFLANMQSFLPDEKQITLIRDTLVQLEELFLVVIAGEYNSGKSSFINALLSKPYLETGITPTTANIYLLKYGRSEREYLDDGNRMIKELPVPLLKNVCIVDTPGTNAILREHEELTKEYIPRSDLIIFVTSVDRPFTESERVFLESIKRWGKKIVFVINKTDIVETENDLEKASQFVSENAFKLLDYRPDIFFLSAKNTLNQIKAGQPSGDLQKIQSYIEKRLSPKNRLFDKLSNPLNILEEMIKAFLGENQQKVSVIKQDTELLENIDHQTILFREDAKRNVQFRYSDIDKTLLEFEKRGLDFFDETFRFARVFDLLNKERMQRKYKDEVANDLALTVDEKTEAIIDWLVEENMNQWLSVNKKISNRVSIFSDQIEAHPKSNEMVLERARIIQSVKRNAQRVIEEFNRENESHDIAEQAQMAVAASAAVEVSALGLGTLVTILATTASADLTGILLAGFSATLGFLIIPTKRKQVKKIFSDNIFKIREQLSETLSNEFENQINLITQNIRETIAPYSRFIKSRQERYQRNREMLNGFLRSINNIRQDIATIKPKS